MPFASTARNGQDVVLHRALGEVSSPSLVSLRREPSAWSLGAALAEHGWTVRDLIAGTPELVAELARLGAPGSPAEGRVGELHVLSVPYDLPLDGLSVRPWVLLVDAPSPTRPAAPAREGYRPVLFDGLSDLLLADEHADLAAPLGYPAGALDDWTTAAQRAAESDRLRWRDAAVRGWHEQVATMPVAAEQVEVHAMMQTVSWRITAPLRAVRSRVPARPRD